EVPVVLDTLWIDLNVDKLVLVWRGHIRVRTIKLKEVEQVLAWTESLSEPKRPATYCPTFLAERQKAEEAEFGVEPLEEADQGEAEFEKSFAEFDRDMEAAEKEIADAMATGDEHFAAQKAQLIAAGFDPALSEPKSIAESASEGLRAEIQRLQAINPEQAAALQKDLAEIEQLEAEFADMDKEFAAEFPPEMTRDDILAPVAR